MGVEDFRLRINADASADTFAETLRWAGLVATENSQQFEIETATYIFEADLVEWSGAAHLSLRFALCHPSTIDSAFVTLALAIAGRVNGTLVVPTPEPGPGRTFSASETDEFETLTRTEIQTARKMWQQIAGMATRKLRCRDALTMLMRR